MHTILTVFRMQRRVDELIGSGRYDDSDDFTVVIQPFMEGVEVPLVRKINTVHTLSQALWVCLVEARWEDGYELFCT